MNIKKFIVSNKWKLLVLFTLAVILIGLLGFNILTTAKDSEKTIFVEALKEDNSSLCLNIRKYAKVTGDEFNSLVDESKNYSIQAIGRKDKFPLRDLCLKAVQTGIELKSWGIDHTKN